MRKNWHKVLSLGLAMVMAFSMAVPAYAAEPPADPLPIQEETQSEEPKIQDTGEVPGSMETTNEESAPVIPAPTMPEKAPEEEVPKKDTPVSDDTGAVAIPDDAVPGDAEPSNDDAENPPANNGPFKVKFLEGSDQYGVIFVDGEEVDIKDFVMELYPTDGVSFCVESSDGEHVPSAVDFTGDCKLEAVEGGFVLSEVKSDVDLLVTYEEGTPDNRLMPVTGFALETTSMDLTKDMYAESLVIPFTEFPIDGVVSNIARTRFDSEGSVEAVDVDSSMAFVSISEDLTAFIITSDQLISAWTDTNAVRFVFEIQLTDGTSTTFTLNTPDHEELQDTWNISKSESDDVHAKLVGSDLVIYGSGYMKDFENGSTARPWHGKNITRLVVSDGVLNIGAYAFMDFRTLLSAEGGKDVVSIGDFAFNNCSAMTSMEFMKYVKTFGKKSFYYCFSLDVIDISNYENCTCTTSDWVFNGNAGNQTRTIIANAAAINNYQVFGYPKYPKLELFQITDLTICTRLAGYIFGSDGASNFDLGMSNATGVLTIEIPNCIVSNWIPTEAGRKRCASQVIVKCPGNTKFADDLRAAGFEVESDDVQPAAVLAETEISFSEDIFENGFSIPLTSCPDGALSVVSVSTTGSSAYSPDLFSIQRSENGASLVVDKDAVWHGAWNFNGKVSDILYTVTLNDEQHSILSFSINYDNVKIWDVSENQDESLIAVLNTTDETLSIKGSGEFKKINSSSEKFGFRFFANLGKHLILDNSITEIPDYCFQNMKFLDISGGENIKSLGTACFSECTNLTSVSFPVVEKIGSSTFLQCKSLKQVSMPKLAKVPDEAFSECGFLELTNDTLQLADQWIIDGNAAFSMLNCTVIDLPNLVEIKGTNAFITNVPGYASAGRTFTAGAAGEAMFSYQRPMNISFPGVESFTCNIFKGSSINSEGSIHFDDLKSLDLLNMKPKTWYASSGSFDIYIPNCKTLSAKGHTMRSNAVFHIANEPAVIKECIDNNLNYVIEDIVEADDVNITLRLYDVSNETYVTLKQDAITAHSGADGIVYTDPYEIPALSSLMKGGKTYSALLNITGPWTGGGQKKEGDFVFFTPGEDLCITYAVYAYGSLAAISSIESMLTPSVTSAANVTSFATRKDAPNTDGWLLSKKVAVRLYDQSGNLIITKSGVTMNYGYSPTQYSGSYKYSSSYYYINIGGSKRCVEKGMRRFNIFPSGFYVIDESRGAFTKLYPDEWSTVDFYLTYSPDILADADADVAFVDGDKTVQSWTVVSGDSIYVPFIDEKPGYVFRGWSKGETEDSMTVNPGTIVPVTEDTTFYAVWDFDLNYEWPQAFTGSVIYYGPSGSVLFRESKELAWGQAFDLREWDLGDSFEKDGITYIVDHEDGLWTGICDRNAIVRVYTTFSPDTVLPDKTVTYRIWDTYNKQYVMIGETTVSQSTSNPRISEALTIPAVTDFDGLVKDDTFVNCYRITGSFLETGAESGSNVTFDMTSDAYVTYWVSIYDENGVPRDQKSEIDSNGTGDKLWSLTYAGLSQYQHFTGTIRYHANYPSGYDPVYTVTMPCSVDTKNNNGMDTAANCMYDSSGNAQIESVLKDGHFKAPDGYKAAGQSIRWNAFHGTNGTTSRSFTCYWYTDRQGTNAVGPNPGPTPNKPVVDVYLKWVPISEDGYEVGFYDGSKLIKSVTNLRSGDFVTAPEALTKSGFVFLGWARDKDSELADVIADGRLKTTNAASYYALWDEVGLSLSLNYMYGKTNVLSQTLGSNFKENDQYNVKDSIKASFDADGHHYVTKAPAKTTGRFSNKDISVAVPCYLDDNHNGIPDENEITVKIPIVDKNGSPVGELEVTGEKDQPFDLTDVIKDPFIDDDGNEWIIREPENGPEIILTESPDSLTADRAPQDFTIDLVTEDGTKVGEITITAVPGDPYDLTSEIENGYADDKGKEYDIVPPAGGNTITAGSINSLTVNPVQSENPNPGEKDPVPPTALTTIVYEFYKDKPSEIAVPIQMNDAKNLIRLRLGNDKMPEDAYGMADDAIILSPEYLMNVEEGAYRLLPTFDDPAGTTIPNLVVKVYESVADRMDPCLFYKRILFDGTNSALKYYEGKGDAYANDVLALVIDDQMVTPEGAVMDFTDENVNALVSKTPMMFRAVYSLLASDAFSAENGQIMLDGPFVSSMNLAAGDHLVGAVFDNTSRTVDVNKVVLTIPKKTITITLEFKTPDGATIAVKEVSGTQGESYDLNKHVPTTIAGSDGKTYVPGELADAKGTFSEDGVVEVPCEPKEETDPGTDPVKPTGDATLTVKFVNPDGRTVRTFTIAGKDGDAYDVSEQIPALFVGTDGKAYKAEVPEDATGFLKGNKTLIVNCVRKTSSVTPIEPDDDDKTPDKDTDKTPTGSVKPIITTGSSNETTTNRITNNTKTVYLGGSKTGGSVTYHTTAGGSGSKDIGAVKETDENTVATPEKTETSNTAAAENEKGDAAMEPIYTGQACGCECMTLVIVLLVIMMFTILLFAAWFIITERRRRDDEKREQARLAAEEQNGAVKE